MLDNIYIGIKAQSQKVTADHVYYGTMTYRLYYYSLELLSGLKTISHKKKTILPKATSATWVLSL